MFWGGVVLFLQPSCSKDKSEQLKNSNQLKTYPLLEWPENCLSTPITNLQDKEELYTFDHNTQQENVMRADDYLALTFVEILKNEPDLIRRVYDYMQAYADTVPDPQFLLDEYFVSYPGDQSIIEGFLSAIMPSGGNLADLEQMMIYDENYKPGISIPNASTANWNYAPIISPAIDVNDELYDATEEDAALAYHMLTNSSPVQEIILNLELMEESSCNRPILVATHMSPKSATATTSLNCNPCNKTYNYGSVFMTYEFKLKHLHERWGNAEVLLRSAHLAPAPGGWWGIVAATGLQPYFKVPQRDEGKLLKRWKAISEGNATAWTGTGLYVDQCRTYFNIVEVGGLHAAKRTFTIYAPSGQILFMQDKRKWTSDWYFQDPYQTQYDFVCDHPGQWYTKWTTNYNAEFNVWRMD